MTETRFEKILEETGTLCYKNVGVSMMPLIREGKDVIVINRRPKERLKKYDVALYTRPGVIGRGAYILHRVIGVNPDGTYRILGDNCVGCETVKEEEILGVLSQVVYKGKNRASGFGYWLYVHTWIAAWPLRIFILRTKGLPRRAAVKALKVLHLYEPVKKLLRKS